jgi:hypothetical protein
MESAGEVGTRRVQTECRTAAILQDYPFKCKGYGSAVNCRGRGKRGRVDAVLPDVAVVCPPERESPSPARSVLL